MTHGSWVSESVVHVQIVFGVGPSRSFCWCHYLVYESFSLAFVKP